MNGWWVALRFGLGAVVGLTGLGPVAQAASVCGLDTGCPVEQGSYRVSPPPGWEERSELPTALFYHGHGGSAAEGMADTTLRKGFADAGVLLIIMDAQHGFWGHQGSRRYTRDDFAYTRAVLADVRKRWPVDEAHLWAAGFSNGGSMVWDLACHGGMFKAYVAIAGEFWKPMPEQCDQGPVDLLHFHGLSDRLVPLEGYRFKGGSALLPLFPSFAMLKRLDGCSPEPDDYGTVRDYTVRLWSTCSSGRELAMVIHPGGHVMPKGWVSLAWEWVRHVTDQTHQVGGTLASTAH